MGDVLTSGALHVGHNDLDDLMLLDPTKGKSIFCFHWDTLEK